MTPLSFSLIAFVHRPRGVLHRCWHAVLLALLVSQMLAPLWGQWHRIAHSTLAQGVLAASIGAGGHEVHRAGHGDVVHAAEAPASSSTHLAGDALCQLLDQLSLTAGPLAHRPVLLAFGLPCADLPLSADPTPWPPAWNFSEARAPPSR